MLSRLIEHYRLAVREARFIRVSLLLAGGLNALAWALFLWFVVPRVSTSPFFALHYTIYFGVDRIGEPWRVGATPLLGTAILLVNIVLMSKVYVKDRMTGTFLMAATVLFEGLLFFVTFLTILLNV